MIEVVYAEEFIKDLKKLKGFDDFFRIRKGDYRIGVRIEKNSIQFLRCMSRKDIYKYFPKK